MNGKEIQRLFARYLSGQLTEEELKSLWDTLQEKEHEGHWEIFAKEIWNKNGVQPASDDILRKRILEKLTPQLQTIVKSRTPFRWRRLCWSAAAMLIVFLGSVYFYKINLPEGVLTKKTEVLRTPQAVYWVHPFTILSDCSLLTAKIPGRQIAIIKYAVGATGIARSSDYNDYMPSLKIITIKGPTGIIQKQTGKPELYMPTFLKT